MQTNETAGIKNIVLVHGAFVDGSGWQGVYRALKENGYSVSVVQNPTITLAGDVSATRRAIAAQDGPVILVGHSYGRNGASETSMAGAGRSQASRLINLVPHKPPQSYLAVTR
jgi:pimeloyl-ACP methyl ester carboxylesterase